MMDTIAGDKQITRSEVANLPMAVALGARHNPIHFIDRIEYITASLIKYGLKIVSEAFVITKNGQKIFGLMQLESVYDDYSTMLAFNGSLDQSIAFNMSFGDGVGICSNLCIWGEYKIKTKQTTYIRERLPEQIDSVVKRLPEKMVERHRVIESYRETQLTARQGDAAITEMIRREIILPSNAGIVVKEWDSPKHEEHTRFNVGDNRSLYQLHQAVTEAQKPNNGRSVIATAMERTPAMEQYFSYIVNQLTK